MIKSTRALLGAALALLPAAAFGQSNYPAPGGQTVPLYLQGCLNGSSQAVPCGAGTPGTVTISGTPTVDTELPAAAAAADASANPTAPFVLGAAELFNGTTWDRWRAALGTVGVAAVNTEGTRATYSGAPTATVAAAAQDVCTITGSGTKTVRVTQVRVTGNATANTSAYIFLYKRSTANTGGTSTAATAVPHDSGSAAATATLLQYTANPTLGNALGYMRLDEMTFVTGSSSSVAANPVVWDFGTRNAQAIVLRGTSQVLAVSLSGQTVTGGVLSCDFEWTEE